MYVHLDGCVSSKTCKYIMDLARKTGETLGAQEGPD